ncbi:hypothetical protein JKP88DRAFT_246867 [Tribonema minus]|uniref:Uncharacterized protein n=1 Tax=Tribonema minus TaxID=303371 RepID=A0A836CBH9_9STRA|nr:hypothetical protein JKP88DRAFT_246867 [Tribonema minus]
MLCSETAEVLHAAVTGAESSISAAISKSPAQHVRHAYISVLLKLMTDHPLTVMLRGDMIFPVAVCSSSVPPFTLAVLLPAAPLPPLSTPLPSPPLSGPAPRKDDAGGGVAAGEDIGVTSASDCPASAPAPPATLATGSDSVDVAEPALDLDLDAALLFLPRQSKSDLPRGSVDDKPPVGLLLVGLWDEGALRLLGLRGLKGGEEEPPSALLDRDRERVRDVRVFLNRFLSSLLMIAAYGLLLGKSIKS